MLITSIYTMVIFVGTILKIIQWKLVVIKFDRSERENKLHFKWLYIHVEVMV